MRTPDSIIIAHQLTVGYPNKIVLTDFTASIQAGGFIVVLGQNGTGKTTFLKTLLGILPPLQGTVTVLNHHPHRGCQEIGYMPQLLFKPEWHYITARSLLTAAIQAKQWGLPHLHAAQRQEIDEVLAAVEAESFADKIFAHCSGGQQRRIMLAQALLGKPQLLLLDEPLAHLDFRHQEKLIAILKKLNDDHRVSIIMTSHDINPLTTVVSQILYLANNQGLLGAPNDILTSEQLSALYQTPMEVIQHGGQYFVVHGSCHPAVIAAR